MAGPTGVVRSRLALGIAGSSLVILLLVAQGAFADHDANVMHACANNENGNLRLVGSADDCRNSETPVELAAAVDLSGVDSPLQQLAAQVQQLQQQGTHHASQISLLQSVNTQQSAQITQLQGLVNQLTSQIQQLQHEDRQHTTGIQQLQQAHNQQAGQISQLQSFDSQLSGQIVQLQSVNSQQTGQINQLLAAIQQLNQRVTALENSP